MDGNGLAKNFSDGLKMIVVGSIGIGIGFATGFAAAPGILTGLVLGAVGAAVGGAAGYLGAGLVIDGVENFDATKKKITKRMKGHLSNVKSFFKGLNTRLDNFIAKQEAFKDAVGKAPAEVNADKSTLAEKTATEDFAKNADTAPVEEKKAAPAATKKAAPKQPKK